MNYLHVIPIGMGFEHKIKLSLERHGISYQRYQCEHGVPNLTKGTFFLSEIDRTPVISMNSLITALDNKNVSIVATCHEIMRIDIIIQARFSIINTKSLFDEGITPELLKLLSS